MSLEGYLTQQFFEDILSHSEKKNNNVNILLLWYIDVNKLVNNQIQMRSFSTFEGVIAYKKDTCWIRDSDR